MKIFIIVVLLPFLYLKANSQPDKQYLIIKGKIKCRMQTERSTKGAENVVVIPSFQPSKATPTLSLPPGYFEINTGIPYAELQDKIVTLYVISRCTQCKEIAKRFIVVEDRDRGNSNDNKKYVTVKGWMLSTNCQAAELAPFASDSILTMVVKLPDQNLDKVPASSPLTTSPGLLNLITTVLSSPVFIAANQGNHYLDSFYEGKVKYGKFLFASPLYESANTGFNFSPSRDMSEAAFWNPSAIAFSRKRNNISVLTNIKNNYKVTAFAHIGKRFSFSAGAIYNMQDEYRHARFTGGAGVYYFYFDSLTMKLKEYAVFAGPQFKITKNLSIGITGKSIWQDYNIPLSASFRATREPVVFVYDTIKKHFLDIDVSATYRIKNYLQIGINLMNLNNTKLDASPYVPKVPNGYIPNDTTRYFENQRSLGLGILYRWKRLNAGTDLLFTKDGLFDATIGVNYVPFNNALVSAGVSLKHLRYSFAFRIKYFRLAYINDDEWLENQRRSGKKAIFNGRIQTGFVVDFNKIIMK